MRSVPTLFSPLLANIALDRIEKHISRLTYQVKNFKKDKNGNIIINKQGKNKGKPQIKETLEICPFGFIRYADDFLVTAPNAECMEAVIPHIIAILEIMGLKLNLTKTQIRHSSQGIDYLGFNIRRYDKKTIIKPEKKKVLSKIQEIRSWLKANTNAPAEAVISYLNPIISGFAYYYRTVCSKEVFGYFDHEIWKALHNWARKKHGKISRKRVNRKYFNVGIKHPDYNKWDFLTITKDRRGKEKVLALLKASSIPIVRHIKVAGRNSKDDPTLIKYWEKRAMNLGNQRFASNSKYLHVAERQNYKCPICGEHIVQEEPLQLHHIIPVNKGGTDKLENLTWMHEACHKITHSKKSKKPESELTIDDWVVTKA